MPNKRETLIKSQDIFFDTGNLLDPRWSMAVFSVFVNNFIINLLKISYFFIWLQLFSFEILNFLCSHWSFNAIEHEQFKILMNWVNYGFIVPPLACILLINLDWTLKSRMLRGRYCNSLSRQSYTMHTLCSFCSAGKMISKSDNTTFFIFDNFHHGYWHLGCLQHYLAKNLYK